MPNDGDKKPKAPASAPAFPEDVSMTGPSRLMWTVQTVAKALEVSDDYVYGLVQRREIPFVRFGTNIRFHYSDVRAYVNRLRDASLDDSAPPAGGRR